MAYITADRIKDTTTTTGTGTVTLSGTAPTGYKTFGSALSTGDTCNYCIVDGATGDWEIGLGTYNATGPTIARTTRISSSTGSAVSFAAGTKDVFLTAPASSIVQTDTTNAVSLLGTDPGLVLGGITTEPSAPPAGALRLYAKSVAGKMVPKIKGPSGLDTPMQNALWQNNVLIWQPTNVTAGWMLGDLSVATGTYSFGTLAATSLYTMQRRSRWANIVTTANQVLGIISQNAQFARGSVAGQGGFFFYARMGFDVWTNGGRMFVGLATATTVVSAEPSALNNTVGFCIDSGDAGAISFLTRSTSATKTSTGYTAVTGNGYDLYMFATPNDSTIYWRIVDTNAGTEASGSATATLPSNTTFLKPCALASNAALTPVKSIQIGLNRLYVETDN